MSDVAEKLADGRVVALDEDEAAVYRAAGLPHVLASDLEKSSEPDGAEVRRQAAEAEADTEAEPTAPNAPARALSDRAARTPFGRAVAGDPSAVPALWGRLQNLHARRRQTKLFSGVAVLDGRMAEARSELVALGVPEATVDGYRAALDSAAADSEPAPRPPRVDRDASLDAWASRLVAAAGDPAETLAAQQWLAFRAATR